MVAIWVGNAHLRKRVYFERFHDAGIAGRGFVIITREVKQTVDD